MKGLTEYRNLYIFQGLSDQQFEQVFDPLEPKCFSRHEVVFDQDADATHLYILLSGKVAIRYKPYDGPVLTIATIIPGWVFGWSAVLGRQSYTSGAVSLEESVVVSISKDKLQNICKIYNDTGIIFLDRLTSSITLRTSNETVLAGITGRDNQQSSHDDA